MSQYEENHSLVLLKLSSVFSSPSPTKQGAIVLRKGILHYNTPYLRNIFVPWTVLHGCIDTHVLRVDLFES
jgi:hypothetical protein